MDVAQVMAQVGLTRSCGEKALAWCREMGAEDIGEVLEEFDDFVSGLGLDGESAGILRRTLETVSALGGEVAFAHLRKDGAVEAVEQPCRVRSVVEKLFDEVDEKLSSVAPDLVSTSARDYSEVDAMVVSEAVAPAVVTECCEMGIPVFIATKRIFDGLDSKERILEPEDGQKVPFYVCDAKAAAEGTREPTGVIRPFQPNLFEPRAMREEKPSAEVWSAPEGEGDEAKRLAKMFRPVATAWAKVIQQKQATHSELDPARLARSVTEEGVVIYEKPPKGGVVVLGCGNSYGGMALAKFFAWRAGEGEGRSSIGASRVLELGAGTGLIGLTLGRLGAHVTMTDYELETLQLMKVNIGANDLSSHVKSQFLEWGDESSYLLDEPFDTIVAGESLYDAYAGEGSAMLLAHAFRAHVQEGSRTVAYLAYRHRSENPLRFFSALADEGFRIERLENESGEAVACSLGPVGAYDGSGFVELDPAVCSAALRKARFPACNGQLTQIIRMSRAAQPA